MQEFEVSLCNITREEGRKKRKEKKCSCHGNFMN
jgi:hypothetical protein